MSLKRMCEVLFVHVLVSYAHRKAMLRRVIDTGTGMMDWYSYILVNNNNTVVKLFTKVP